MKRISHVLSLACVLGLTQLAGARDYEYGAAQVTATDKESPAAGARVDNGCETCVSDADDCRSCPCGGWYAGVGATYLSIVPKNRPVLPDVTDDLDDTRTFDYGFEAAPRIWLGYQFDNCWGVRARYWQFDAEDNVALGTLATANSELGLFTSQFEAYTVDLELTRRFERGNWALLATGGVRIASIEHTFAGQVVDNGANDSESLGIHRRIEGAGLTGVLEGWRPIGCRGLSVFFSARGSVIWADNKSRSGLIELEGGSVTTDGDTSSDNDEIFIADLQLGLQWSAPIKCLGGAEAFVRGALEYQTWLLKRHDIQGVGDSDDFPEDPGRVDSLGRGDVDFYGLAFSAGIIR